jgi:hypothetical protein
MGEFLEVADVVFNNLFVVCEELLDQPAVVREVDAVVFNGAEILPQRSLDLDPAVAEDKVIGEPGLKVGVKAAEEDIFDAGIHTGGKGTVLIVGEVDLRGKEVDEGQQENKAHENQACDALDDQFSFSAAVFHKHLRI